MKYASIVIGARGGSRSQRPPQGAPRCVPSPCAWPRSIPFVVVPHSYLVSMLGRNPFIYSIRRPFRAFHSPTPVAPSILTHLPHPGAPLLCPDRRYPFPARSPRCLPPRPTATPPCPHYRFSNRDPGTASLCRRVLSQPPAIREPHHGQDDGRQPYQRGSVHLGYLASLCYPLIERKV